ncbi:hypothetical protein E2C01_059538 [Portunus trituberculatus]|uniref:Uncharacterized protein n=1 Tax=Portunus trituberculatus TaxID=210409 RepID=A0A5B7H9B8_PORTR|nr:hypothetical protein [Portunus trituberculatus]
MLCVSRSCFSIVGWNLFYFILFFFILSPSFPYKNHFRSNSPPLLKVGNDYQVLSVVEWTEYERFKIHSVTALRQGLCLSPAFSALGLSVISFCRLEGTLILCIVLPEPHHLLQSEAGSRWAVARWPTNLKI